MSDDFVGRMSHFHSRNGLLDREKLTDRIEKLEAANLKASLITVEHLSRIEKLEAALNKFLDDWDDGGPMCEPLRKALEGK